ATRVDELEATLFCAADSSDCTSAAAPLFSDPLGGSFGGSFGGGVSACAVNGGIVSATLWPVAVVIAGSLGLETSVRFATGSVATTVGVGGAAGLMKKYAPAPAAATPAASISRPPIPTATLRSAPSISVSRSASAGKRSSGFGDIARINARA